MAGFVVSTEAFLQTPWRNIDKNFLSLPLNLPIYLKLANHPAELYGC